MNEDLLHGDLVRLTHEEPETLATLESQWCANSEYSRLLDWDPARRFSAKTVKNGSRKSTRTKKLFAFPFACSRPTSHWQDRPGRYQLDAPRHLRGHWPG